MKVRYLGPKLYTVTHSPEHPALTRRNDRLRFGSANRCLIEALPSRAVRGILAPRQTGGTCNSIDFQRHDSLRDVGARSVDPVDAVSAFSNSTIVNVTPASEIIRCG